MMRRRRGQRDIPFSFDSFLDVVANVVGIIIRLILVVWVGARSYSSLPQSAPPPNPPAEASVTEAEPASEPLEEELAEQRRQLAEAEKALLDHLRELQDAQQLQEQRRGELAVLAGRRQSLAVQRADLEQHVAEERQTAKTAALSLEELRERCRRLAEEMATLKQQPPVRRALRYRTPVSRPLDADELMFECRNGRVTFIDLGPLLEEVKRTLREKAELLKSQWQVSDVAGPVGAFRLRYTVERERGELDVAGGAPDPNASFRYGLSAWHVEPVASSRGETLEQALRPGSEFRQIADRLDPQHAAVTFWVYPDSFDLYRKLRDYLYERDLVVAGRPLPDGVPISSSRHGTVSRGQ